MTVVNIRPSVESDAEAFLDLWDALDTETQFMLFEPDERRASLDDQRARLVNAGVATRVHTGHPY